MQQQASNLLLTLPCSPASMAVEEVIITPLPLTSGWASKGGREGKTFNQNAELLTKGPVNKCACNLIKSGRWCAEKGQDLIIWLMAYSRWGTQTGWGTSGESQLAGPLATQEPQVDIWAHDLVPQGQLAPCALQKARRNGIYPVGWRKEHPISVFKPMEKKMRCHEFSICDDSNRARAMLPLPSFCLCRQFCLVRVPAIYLREKLFLKAFPRLWSIHQTTDTNLNYLKFNFKGILGEPTMCQSQPTF